MIRKHIIFHGSVQGVGFRYRARHAADTFGCTGWAKNEYDGTVSMEIQGEEEAIDRWLFAYNSEFDLFLRHDEGLIHRIPCHNLTKLTD